MPENEKTDLVNNLIGHMKPVSKPIQKLQLSHFYKADPEYGESIAKGLGIAISEIK